MGDFKNDLMAARFKLTVQAPYYARVAYAVQLVEVKDMNTLGVTEDWHLLYDPDLDKGRLNPETGERTLPPWNNDELVAIMAHEMNHLLRNHLQRRPEIAHPYAWNIAGDAEINDDLKSAGWKIPDDCVFPSSIGQKDGLTAEEYFAGMEKQAQNQQGDGDGDGEGVPLYGDGKGSPGAGNCGSGAHGKKSKVEEEHKGDGSSLSETERELVRRQVAKDVKEHAKQTGKDPADLGRWADSILEHTVDWRKELASLVRNAFARARGKQDYTYSRPNFRRGWDGRENNYIFPGTYQPVPNIVVVVDTSGSISQSELTSAVSEINGICQSLGAAQSVTVLSCDANVHSVQKVFDARQISKLKGGGGTDMGVGIKAAKKLKAQVCVVITDGYTPWPKDAPRGMSTVVALLGENASHSTPNWAKEVVIKTEK